MYNSDDKGMNATTPYRASGNLNTSIGNPSMDVNNAMQINIQSVNTAANNKTNVSVNTNNTSKPVTNANNSVPKSATNKEQVNKQSKTVVPNNYVNSSNADKEGIKKAYVPNQNQNHTSQKNGKVKMGAEFRFAFLIVVLLLAFVLLLPMITSFITGD